MVDLVIWSHIENAPTPTAYPTRVLPLGLQDTWAQLCSSQTLEKDLLSSSSKHRVPGPGAILKRGGYCLNLDHVGVRITGTPRHWDPQALHCTVMGSIYLPHESNLVIRVADLSPLDVLQYRELGLAGRGRWCLQEPDQGTCSEISV